MNNVWVCPFHDFAFVCLVALLIVKVCLLVSKPGLLAWAEPWQRTIGNCLPFSPAQMLQCRFQSNLEQDRTRLGFTRVYEQSQRIWCCNISIPLVGSTPEHLRMPSNVSSYHPIKRELPKKTHYRPIQRVELCHYPLTRIKQLISLSQTRKCSLFFWSFREEVLGIQLSPGFLAKKLAALFWQPPTCTTSILFV